MIPGFFLAENKCNETEKILICTKVVEEYSFDKINSLHALVKQYMRMHGGYNREDLQDWMNLIWFILSKPDNRYEKIDLFLNMALNAPGKVRYRDRMAKNVNK